MNMKENYSEFISEIKERGIEKLIHFTPTRNLYSIFEQKKIMSRLALENLDIYQFDIVDYVQFTDNIRFDDPSYINLSISCPNQWLFNKFREQTKNDFTISWCILEIDPKHIYDKQTLFAVTNAASNAAKRQFGIDGSLGKFRQLFSNRVTYNASYGVRTLTRESVLPKYPTDIQAEVLVKDMIPLESILSVSFETDLDLAQAKAALYTFDTSKFNVNPEAFTPNRSI